MTPSGRTRAMMTYSSHYRVRRFPSARAPRLEYLEDRTLPSSSPRGTGLLTRLLESNLRDALRPAEVRHQGGQPAVVEPAVSTEAKGSFSSGPGYPLPPATGPTLQNDLV